MALIRPLFSRAVAAVAPFILFACGGGNLPNPDEQLGSSTAAINTFTRMQVRSMSTWKCMDVASGVTDPGNAIVQFSCHRGPNQRFELLEAGGSFLIASELTSNRCVGVQTPGYNQLLMVMPCFDSSGRSPPNVRWDLDGPDLRTPGISHVRIQSHADRNFCIDVPSGLDWDSLWLQTYGCHDGLNQKWELTNW